MGVGPTKEKLLEIIKTSSKTNETQNYKIEYHIEEESKISGGDEESLDKDNYSDYNNQTLSSLCTVVKDINSFPYKTIGTIKIKFHGGETPIEGTCFLINKNVIITYLNFLVNGNKKIVEISTNLTKEKLNLKKCQKYEKKNLAIFFLEREKFSQWLGVDIYDKKNNEKNHNINNKIKAIFSIGNESERTESSVFLEERTSSFSNEPFLKEINYDLDNINKYNGDKSLKTKIIGGVVYYKNQNGGFYVIGIIDKNLQVNYFDQETLKYLYFQVNKEELSKKEGLDVKNITELDLSRKNIGPSHIKLLTEFDFVNLKKLNLLKNQIGPQGAFYLGQSRFSNLEVLILNFNEIGDEGVQYLSKGPFFELKYLYLFHNNISNIGLESILCSIFNDNLLLLDLSDNPNINEEGIGNIKNKISTNKTVFNKLLCLNLSATTINEKGLDLLNNIEFPKLKKLILQDIDFSKNKNLINSLKKKSYELKLD